MHKYIFKRILIAIFTLCVVLIFSYTLIAAFGKNPYDIKLAIMRESGGKDFKLIKEIERQRENYANTPIIVKFANYFGKLFKGDVGTYFGKIGQTSYENISVRKVFWQFLPKSLLISIPAFVISAILGSVLGIVAGYKRGTPVDHAINVFVFIFIAIPSFIIAPIFIQIFTSFGFPVKYVPFIRGDTTGRFTFIKSLKSVIPPILVVSLTSMAIYTLYARNQTVTVLTSNYILIAKTKGLSGSQIFWKYVLRNISIPLTALILPSYIWLLSGSIIVERFWDVEGTAMILAYAFPNGEINAVMYSILLFTTLTLFTDILVDISFVILDPRIVYENSSKRDYIKIIKMYFLRKKKMNKLFAEQEANNLSPEIKADTK